MGSPWPWVAVAGFGALHGLNPSTGWMLAAACGVHSRDGKQALRALGPIAVGHALSVGLVVAAVAFGLSMDRALLQALVGGLLLVVAICRLTGARLALWSFIVSTAHGAGLMMLPALMPLCVADVPGAEIRASGSLAAVIAAVGVHTAAMLAVTGLIATGVCGSVEAARRFLGSVRLLPARR